MFFDCQEDAERLLRNCKRYDLLNQFYQNSGQWGKVSNSMFGLLVAGTVKHRFKTTPLLRPPF